MTTKQRVAWIDSLRACAILAVVLCHAVEGIYSLNLEYMDQLSMASKGFAFLAFTLGRGGVPLFLLISGYLLLDREYDARATRVFYEKNCLHLLVCTEIWIIIYDLFGSLYWNTSISIWDTLGRMLFFKPINAIHMWYLPMILGFYVLIPAVAKGIQSMNGNVFRYLLIFFALYTFGSSFLRTVSNIFGKTPLSPTISSGFSGGAYGIYLLIGYGIKRGGLKSMRTTILLLAAFISFILTAGLQIVAYHYSYQYNVGYDDLFLMLFSVSIFELGSRLKVSGKAASLIQFISIYSFPVFLIHAIPYTILTPILGRLEFSRPIKVCMLFLCVYLSSLGCGWLIRCLPKFGNYVLYFKAENKNGRLESKTRNN